MDNSNDLKFNAVKVDIIPEDVGYRSDNIEQVDKLFADLVKSKKLQCANYLIAKNDKLIACKSVGKLSYKEDSGDFLPDSIRIIASITKLFTSVAIMQLIEQGKLYLYQPAADFIEEFNTPQHSKISIFHLLTHTSGINADSGYFTEAYPKRWWSSDSKDNWIKQTLAGPSLCKPGEGWNYSSAGFMLLGEIISRISGITYEEYVMKNIVEPLGMKDTFFDVPEELKDRICYTSAEQEKWFNSSKERAGGPPRAGGGLFSTAIDLWKVSQMFLNNGVFCGKRILSRKSIEAMSHNHLFGVPAYCWGHDFKEYKYGLGLGISTNHETLASLSVYGHEGAGRSALYIDPTEQFTAIFFIPSEIDWVPEAAINPRNVIWAGLI